MIENSEQKQNLEVNTSNDVNSSEYNKLKVNEDSSTDRNLDKKDTEVTEKVENVDTPLTTEINIVDSNTTNN